jgi:phage-related protein
MASDLPPGWVKKFNDKKGKDYYYHAESKTSQWDPPAPANDTAKTVKTAKDAAAAVADAADTLPAGWVKKFNDKKGKDYYYHAETKTSQWDPPEKSKTESSSLSAAAGGTAEVLPSGWVKKHNEKKGKDYYYHAETKTSQWDSPSGTVLTAPTSVSDIKSTPTPPTAAEATEMLPVGWVKKFNDKKGKSYYYHAETKVSQWDPPPGTTAAAPKTDIGKETTAAKGVSEELPSGWVKKYNDKKGKDYYYHAETKTSQWTPPAGVISSADAKGAAATKSTVSTPAADSEKGDVLPSGWVKKFNDKKGKYYYFNSETKVSQWDPPQGAVLTALEAAPVKSSTAGGSEILPAGWVKKHNEKKGKDYYFHASSKTSQWTAPEGTVSAAAAGSIATSEAATSSAVTSFVEKLPIGWVKKHNEKKGKDYYYHQATKTSQWTPPEGTTMSSGPQIILATAPAFVIASTMDWKLFVWLLNVGDSTPKLRVASLSGHGNTARASFKNICPKVEKGSESSSSSSAETSFWLSDIRLLRFEKVSHEGAYSTVWYSN